MTPDALTPADVLARAVQADGDGDVHDLDTELARQAVELARCLGSDLADLLQTRKWFYYPHLILSIAFEGADLDRECRLYAAWCARQALRMVPESRRADAERCIDVAEAFAFGKATVHEMRAARAAVSADLFYAACGAAWGTASVDARIAAKNSSLDAAMVAAAAAGVDPIAKRAAVDAVRAMQQDRLVNIILNALGGAR